MPRPKGYKLSEEAKKRIGDASRNRWNNRHEAIRLANDIKEKLEPPKEVFTKKWWQFWL